MATRLLHGTISNHFRVQSDHVPEIRRGSLLLGKNAAYGLRDVMTAFFDINNKMY
jgi:hypothetical protein